MASCLALALALALSAGACGRVGYDGLSDAKLSDAGANAGGDGGGSLQCEGDPGPNCANSTINVTIGGTTTLTDNLQNYPSPLIPECGQGPVSEGRTRLVSPPAPALVTFEVVANMEITLSILADDCDGPSQSCTVFSANSNDSVQITTQPGETYILVTTSNDSCGDVQLTIRAVAAPTA